MLSHASRVLWLEKFLSLDDQDTFVPVENPCRNRQVINPKLGHNAPRDELVSGMVDAAAPQQLALVWFLAHCILQPFRRKF